MANTISISSMTDVACEHKIRIGCALTALPVCCSCADKRPEAPAYPVYVDGEGMKMRGKRWTRYCWKCRDHWNLDNTESADLQDPADFTLNSHSQPTMSYQIPRDHPPPLPPLNPQAQPWPIAQRANAHLSQFAPQPHPPTLPQYRPPIFPLGTREDVEQEDYQSPVGLMFQRAYERYRTAEEVRQEVMATLGVPPELVRTFDPTIQHANFLQTELPVRFQQNYIPVGQPLYDGTRIQLGYPANNMPLMENYGTAQAQPLAVGPEEEENGDDGTNAVDRQPRRPEPLSAESMMISIACKMCLEQKIDTLIEPCMHLALCRWCSDLWQTNARNMRHMDPGMSQPWKCPMCRKGIQQVRRVYF